MKFQFKAILVSFAIALTLVSCSNDDDKQETISGEGSLTLEFDNVYKDANVAFNTAYTNSNGEVVKLTTEKYIVSKIGLTKADGSTCTIPKSQSYLKGDGSK